MITIKLAALFIVIYFVFFIMSLYCMHVRMPCVLIKELTYLLTYVQKYTNTF